MRIIEDDVLMIKSKYLTLKNNKNDKTKTTQSYF